MKRIRIVFVITFVVVSFSTAGMTTVTTGSPPQTADTTEIDSCTIITSPGTYVLTENITDSTENICINVYADDVTIDGNGHVIDEAVTGMDGPGYTAIDGSEQHDLTVKNVVITDWQYGILKVLAGTDTEIRNVTAVRNAIGISVTSKSAIIANNTVRQNQHPDPDGPLTEERGKGISVAGHNVTVRDNLAVNNEVDIGVAGENATIVDNRISQTTASADHDAGIHIPSPLEPGLNARVLNNTITGTDVKLDSHNLTLASNELIDGNITVNGDGATIRGNVVRNGSIAHGGSASDLSVVRDNVVTGRETGIQIGRVTELQQRETRVLVTNNTVTDTEVGIHLVGSEEEPRPGPGGPVEPNQTVIDTRVTNATTALLIGNYNGSLIENNSFTGNANGIRIEAVSEVAGTAPVGEIHRNDLGANEEYGVLNEDEVVVNATRNYWGAPDGPSSRTEEPLEDPVTGALADGSGSAVSEGAIDGVSNVRFDPWMTQPVMTARVGDFENPPTDLDGDGRFEDINGDGVFDVVDVQALFANRGDPTIQNNPQKFDFNGDGGFDVVDVQALFTEPYTYGN